METSQLGKELWSKEVWLEDLGGGGLVGACCIIHVQIYVGLCGFLLLG